MALFGLFKKEKEKSEFLRPPKSIIRDFSAIVVAPKQSDKYIEEIKEEIKQLGGLEKTLNFYEDKMFRNNADIKFKLAYLYGQSKLSNGQIKSYSQRYDATEMGHIGAIYLVAQAYHYGEGTTQDFEKALYWYETGAYAGDINCRYGAGCICFSEEYDKKDTKKAIKWLEFAAQNNNVFAIAKLARAYFEGDGVSQDYTTAFTLYKKANDISDYFCYELGEFYENGWGTEKDLSKAFETYKKMEWINRYDYKLALFYYHGWGTERNLDEALKHAERAYANLNDTELKKECYKLLMSIRGMEDSYNALRPVEEIVRNFDAITVAPVQSYEYVNERLEGDNEAELDDKTSKQLDEYLKKGDVDAAFNLAMMYDGKDVYKVLYAMKQLAKYGHIGAYYILGLINYQGTGIRYDYEEALYWFETGGYAGDISCRSRAGDMHKEGKGTKKDLHKAFQWYYVATKFGKGNINYKIAECYENGWGTEKDLYMAFYHYSKAGRNKIPEAYLKIATFSRNGWGVTKDMVAAVQFMEDYIKTIEDENERQKYIDIKLKYAAEI